MNITMNQRVTVTAGLWLGYHGRINVLPHGTSRSVGVLLDNGRMIIIATTAIKPQEDKSAEAKPS